MSGTVVGIVGSPHTRSRSRTLLNHAATAARRAGATVHTVDLRALPAAGLLGRRRRPAVDRAIAEVMRARVILAATPTYRASYTGLIKTFFDLLPDDALVGRVGVPIVTGTSLDDLQLAGQALRILFGSLGADVVATGAYAADADFTGDRPSEPVVRRVERAVGEALASAERSVR
jgi:FMN reductase